jgi:hypothetical protein
MPSETVYNWSDNGTIYYLQKRSVPRVNRNTEGDFLASRYPIYYGKSCEIWTFSQIVYRKVKSWIEGMIIESITIRWEQKCPFNTNRKTHI